MRTIQLVNDTILPYSPYNLSMIRSFQAKPTKWPQMPAAVCHTTGSYANTSQTANILIASGRGTCAFPQATHTPIMLPTRLSEPLMCTSEAIQPKPVPTTNPKPEATPKHKPKAKPELEPKAKAKARAKAQAKATP